MLDSQFSQNNGQPPVVNNNGVRGGGSVAPGIAVIGGTSRRPGNAGSPELLNWVPVEDPPEGKKIQVSDNMSTIDRVVLCASEATATAILVFLGCMGCVKGISAEAPPHLQVSLTFGLAVMVSVQCFGHVSGSHINPIVTVAAATLGNIPLIQVPIYFTGQLLGALGGFGLLKAVTPPEFVYPVNATAGLCSPGVNPLITPFQGLLVEFTISFMLVLVCCGVWDCRNNTKHDSVALRFGLAIAVLAMAAGPYSGANMNPVRSFAPALINGDWENHWIYWVGPLGAGFLGALFYRFLFGKEGEPEERNNLPETIALNDKA